MSRLAEAARGTMLRFLVGCAALYALAVALIPALLMTLGFSGIALGTSAGVCFTYAPILGGALVSRRPDGTDYLGGGIFFVSAGVFAMRVMLSAARDLGHPEIYNSDSMPAALVLVIIGAWFHLRALDVGVGHLPRPRRRWVNGGAAVALGVCLAFPLGVAHVHTGAAPSVQLR